jgi:purine-binding chemotaxis protein CheW
MNSEPESLKVIVFPIAGYFLALPIETVFKVANIPPQLKTSANAIDLLHLGQQVITVLNLQPHFAMQQSPKNKGQFLVIIQPPQGEFCAIRVDAPPDLMELPRSVVRTMPTAYREGHPLKIATHLAVLPQGEKMLPIFLMDLNRAMAVLQE